MTVNRPVNRNAPRRDPIIRSISISAIARPSLLVHRVSRETSVAFGTSVTFCRLRATPADQLERNRDGSSGLSRIGSKGVRSVLSATPSAISSARASPVAGALRMPQTLWPVAT
jgi:hypothetical protein